LAFEKSFFMDTPTTDPVLVLKTPAAAKAVGLSEDEVRRLAHAGEIAHFRTTGGHLRYTIADLREFLARRVEERRHEMSGR